MDDLKHLVRKRLNSILSSIDTYPLTIVEAPAGYGKTTAVRDYLAEWRGDALWLSFQRLHDLEEIWLQFTKEIENRDPFTGKKLAGLGFPANILEREKAISILSDMELKHSTAVVFDNYELAAGSGLAGLFLRLAEEKIDHLHLVVLTRDTTEFDLAVSLARKRCHVISRSQLKFTREEVQEYCTLAQCRIEEGMADRLIAYTDGWISLIYVLLSGLENGISIGLNPTLAELIDKSLFQVHGGEIRRYLLQLSVMDSFTTRQADYVTDRSDSSERLRMLRKMNAFIQYDERERRYRIHPILLDFLRARQNFSAEEERALYRRLGHWLLREEDPRPAYICLSKAGETEQILAHLNRPVPVRLLYTDFEGANESFASVPREVRNHYPIAYLRYLLYCVIGDKKMMINELSQGLDELEAFWKQENELAEDERNRVLGEILCVRKFTAFNDMPRMHAYNSDIVRLLNGRQSLIMPGGSEFTFGLPQYLYIYFCEAGTLADLAALSRHAEYTAFSSGNGTGVDCLATAEHALETGDFQTAVTESRKAVYKADTKAQHSVMLCARFCGARASLALGQLQTARELLRTLREDAEQQSRPVYLSTARLCEGYLNASLDLPLSQWLKDGDLSSLKLFFGGMGYDKLVYGKALLAQGEYLKLEALADSFEESFAVFRNRLGFLHGAILRAAAKSHLSGAEAAVPELTRALDLARPDGIVLPFAECARHLLPIFPALPKQTREDAFASRVQELCTTYLDAVKPLLPEDQSLTARETEILRLLNGGLTRNEIAARLFISPGTVKVHLHTIYQKLDADGKVSALRTARKNGLI